MLRSWKHAWLALLLILALQVAAQSLAAEDSVAYLAMCDATDRVGIASDVAADLAQRLVSATIVLPTEDGRFVDRDGRPVALDSFRVLWCHQTDTARPSPFLSDAKWSQRLRQYVAGGHGLLLSGSAAALLQPMQVDTIHTAELQTNQDRAQAGLVPLARQHPAFRALDLEGGNLWMSNAVFPAFAQFHTTSSPAKGSVLAQTPGGAEIPLIEYSAGEGRIIVLAWHPGRLYDEAPAKYRANFEGLTKNLLQYLGAKDHWQPLPISGDIAAQAGSVDPLSSDDPWQSLELAIEDLTETFPDRYTDGPAYLQRLRALQLARSEMRKVSPPSATPSASEIARQFDQLRREALLANPLLDFQRLLLVKRGAGNLGLPMNYESNSSLPSTGYDNQIAVLSPVRPDGKLTTLYQPEGARFVGDVDLHFDADRILFSMPGSNGRWQVYELRTDGSGLRELPLIQEPDVDNYDACYLPDGRIVFGSTACFTGVPCVNGTSHVSNLYLLETSGKIRQLTVEQDHDWCPTVLNNGRVLYLRWEYTDIPHAFSRILFHMNPDGTEQFEYYGSNSYWPASMFFARPIPGHPTKVVAVVGGHHELPRMGELVVFDPARGRFEADGAVQRIPGRGHKVAPVMLDLPIAQSWPKFLHPYPLSEKYFLVSCKPSADACWGVYLADVFDNLLLLYEEPGYAMLEPIALRKTSRPPSIPDKIDPARRDAEIAIADIYRGDGLRHVPRGTIERLRVISYQFGYQGMGAEPYSVGLDGPWDPKRILGTVPVCADGSVRFRIPAYTPIALQPLDAEGKAVQLMRSWLTAMPGEVVSCVGCHERQNTAPPVGKSLGATQPPVDIKPWYGPPRGFAFGREVQPVLDRYCIGCHDGKPRQEGPAICSLVDGPATPTQTNGTAINQGSRFSTSYFQLRRFVRTPTKESDMHLLPPWEFHADTTRLVQMLQKGHYQVQLDAEAWDRLITWIDLNAPYHGNWSDVRGGEIGPEVKHQAERRRSMRKRYTGMDEDWEAMHPPAQLVPAAPGSTTTPISVSASSPVPTPVASSSPSGSQAGNESGATVSVPLANGVVLELVRIPAGEFLMGQEGGNVDERPAIRVKIGSPFWMGRFEVTNEQFAQFAPAHRSRLEHGDFLQFSPGERGWSLARPKQPVVRVSWNEAVAFCRWLTQKTGRPFTLPTEAQWEYACRASTTTPLSYGVVTDDFSPFANVSDASHLAIERFGESGRPDFIPAWRPADSRFDDRSRVSAPVGSYRPNPWGLYDMHGNVAEWTRSPYRPYPYRDNPDSQQTHAADKKVVRGGSWYDCPQRCRSAFRQAYAACQPVYDVGFRVVCEADATADSAASPLSHLPLR